MKRMAEVVELKKGFPMVNVVASNSSVSIHERAAREYARDGGSERGNSTSDVGINLDILPTLLGYNIRRAQIELWRDFGASVADGEIRPGLFSIMLLIGANPGIAQIDLANHLGVDKASIVALIDRLESAGWVQRKRSAEDRRRQEIFMTPAGAKKLAQLKREVLEHDAKFCSLFTPDELRQFLDFLKRIHRH